MPLTVDAFDHLVVNVRDVDVAAAWYQRVLGMTREDFDPGPGKVRRTSMKFGRQKINLRPVTASKTDWFTADHEAAGSDDLCFLTKATPQQVGLDKTARAQNVQGAFRVPPEGKAEVTSRKLVLVDDVLTSGATIDACARALLRAGAQSVDVLVFARVVAGNRAPI
jgi:catechol 2,3-dioxygenase-like lactoylglutathione lyase family enzyme